MRDGDGVDGATRRDQLYYALGWMEALLEQGLHLRIIFISLAYT